ncbi:MAG TPA: ABC transporter permease [Dissulfurispiraceae bacterium]
MRTGLSDLLKYKDLLMVFVWREFNLRYKQSIFGVLWALVQPLSMMLLFTFIFTYVMPSRVSRYPYPVFFYSALLPWTFFASSLNYAMPSLVNHYNLITKIYFPREILPLSGVALSLIDLIISASLLLLLLVIYQIPFTIQILWVFPLVLLLVLFTVTMALVLSALNVYYRDVNLAIHFLMQLWFFATPVFYSVDSVPAWIKTLLFLNPLTFIVENMRRCLIEGRSVVWWQYASMLAFVAGTSLAGYKVFKNTEKRFADVI